MSEDAKKGQGHDWLHLLPRFFGFGPLIEQALGRREERKGGKRSESSDPLPGLRSKRLVRVLDGPWLWLALLLLLLAWAAPPLLVLSLVLTFLGAFAVIAPIHKHFGWTSSEHHNRIFMTWMAAVLLIGAGVAR